LKTTTKIRWLLLIVTLGLFATAFTARWASTRNFSLQENAEKISKRLEKKETLILSYLNDEKKFNELFTLDKQPEKAFQTIEYFNAENIYFHVFKNNKLAFWSDNKISTSSINKIRSGSNFVEYKNGWYEVIKKIKQPNQFVLFYIPVKSKLPYKNQFLNSNNSTDIIQDQNILIADLTDKNVVDIKNTNNRYLFSIKRTPTINNVNYTKIEMIMWCTALCTLILLLNSIAKYYADKGKPGLAASGLLVAFIFIRYLSIRFHFPNALYNLEIFNPSIYAANAYFPSLADFGLNVIGFLWFTVFLYSYKEKIFKPIENKWLAYPIIIYCIIFVVLISFALSDILAGLVFNSNINLKVTNLINLDVWSFIGIILLLLTLLTYHLLVDILITFSYYIKISIRNKVLLLVITLILFCVYSYNIENYTIYLILILLLILILGRIVYQYKGQIVFPALVLITLIFATLVSIKLNRYENIKEKETRKRLANKLESVDDPNAVVLFSEIEKEIADDQIIKDLIKDPEINDSQLYHRFQSHYLSGYLSEYDFKVLSIKQDSNSLVNNDAELKNLKSLVENGSLKVTEYFYRVNNVFGVQSYFAIFPFKEDNQIIGTLILELKSNNIREFGAFPQFLKDGKLISIEDYVDYSYAYYDNGNLKYQYGKYVYDLNNKSFKARFKNFVIVRIGGYSHMVYQPASDKLIVISKEYNTVWREIASLSFFFIIFLLFGSIILSYKWIWNTLTSYKFSFSHFKLRVLLNTNKILYKTRIQIALVLAVVTSLIIIGIITFSYLSIQYKDQQEDLIKERIKTMTAAFENKIYQQNLESNKEDIYPFTEIAKMYNADLYLYNTDGILINSTQFKLFNVGILANRMNPTAYINLSQLQKSEYIQDENIENLKFKSAYMPVQDSYNNVVAYLQLPYFSNQNEYTQKIGNFINLLINIYVLVFIAIGFFAFVVANQITSPLTLIQENMAKTEIGRKNEPIPWRRNDEIGNLISEYNKMILALDESANKLARSERETAWREMAKQVAHEIKNPLTPLRLGIQMLERSWKEKDPNFEKKFEKFNKSFIEQIDSLSHIASEFSNFAKMPDLKLEDFTVSSVLNQAIQVYKQMAHVVIEYNEADFSNHWIRADKDQLLRSFNNLLKNAIEALPEDKEGKIVIMCTQTDNKIKLSIEDNGNGISEDLIDKIFTPNFTTKSSGTGLGLAFVKQAIEIIGGNVYFNTELNKGTIFYIILPLIDKFKKG
jgi:two-component system nitrogen regulation sensor histidine kinase NtrY